MAYILFIAGLSGKEFDRISRESANRLAPAGNLVMSPLLDQIYTKRYSQELIQRAHAVAEKILESEALRCLLLYMDLGGDHSKAFLDDFFPFCLPMRLERVPTEPGSSTRILNENLNKFAENVAKSAVALRARSNVVSDVTGAGSISPLLLPVKNFQSGALVPLLRQLYDQLAHHDNPRQLISNEIQKFFNSCPRAYAPGQSRHCFSDGHLYYQSPGKNRHGFFRNSSTSHHEPACLLNARSRLGGHYDYKLHYDCIPTRGKLHQAYPDCHGERREPKSKHVNIAPNDYII